MLERLRMGRSFHHRPRAEARRTAGEAGGVSLYAETEAAKPTSRRAAPTCTCYALRTLAACARCHGGLAQVLMPAAGRSMMVDKWPCGVAPRWACPNPLRVRILTRSHRRWEALWSHPLTVTASAEIPVSRHLLGACVSAEFVTINVHTLEAGLLIPAAPSSGRECPAS